MKDIEKELIKELFLRLKKTESKNSVRDIEAENYILKMLKGQPNSVYYMIQTVLIQENAIQKLHDEINKLKEIVKNQKGIIDTNCKSSGFLSGFFNSKKHSNNTNIDKRYPSFSDSTDNSNFSKNSIPIQDTKSSNSFLGNALQTAIGVAGGMVTANMLMNLFNNKSVTEVFHTQKDLNTSNDLFQEKKNDDNDFDENYVINEEETLPESEESYLDFESTNLIDSDDNDDYL